MELIRELRMSAIILIVGAFFLTGCFFKEKYTVTFKTNGGSEVANVVVRDGNKIEEPEIPQKDGYVFIGWYLDGEEFDFDKAISEDITLVAKWGTIDADEAEDTNDDENDDENAEEVKSETSDTTTSKKTTTKKTATKTTKKTTSKTKTTTSKTDSPKEETPAKATSLTTTSTTSSSTTTTTSSSTITTTSSTTTSSTTSSTTSKVTTDMDEPVPPETIHKVPMALTKSDEQLEINFVTSEEKGNVISELMEEDYQTFLASVHVKWNFFDQHFDEITKNLTGEERITLIGNFTNLIVYDSQKYYSLLYDIDAGKWTLTYPSVTVTYEDTLASVEDNKENLSQTSVRDPQPLSEEATKTMYFNTLEDALLKTPENGLITIYKDLTVKNVTISHALTIDGNNHTLTNDEGYIFTFDNIDNAEASINIENLNVTTASFMAFGPQVVIKSINFANMQIDYRENIKNDITYPGLINYSNVVFILSYE